MGALPWEQPHKASWRAGLVQDREELILASGSPPPIPRTPLEERLSGLPAAAQASLHPAVLPLLP